MTRTRWPIVVAVALSSSACWDRSDWSVERPVQNCDGVHAGTAEPPRPRMPDLLTQDLRTAEIALMARTGENEDDIGSERGCELALARGRAQLRVFSPEVPDETFDVGVSSEVVAYIVHLLDVGPAMTYENDIGAEGRWGWLELHARAGTAEFRYDVVGMLEAGEGAAPLPYGASRVDFVCAGLHDLMRELSAARA